MKYNLLLADADGTIMDFHAGEEKALAMACEAMGLAIDEAQAAEYKAINEALWRAFERREVTQEALRVLRFSRFLAYLGVTADAEAMADAYVQALSEQIDEMPGAHDFMREAAARVPVIIVTNGIPSVQRGRFSRSPLRAYIRDYVISGEMGFAKPDPRMIERAIALSGLSDSRPLMLGDEPRSDIAAACRAGIDSCWYNPAGRANETGYVPTHAVQALGEVLAWL